MFNKPTTNYNTNHYPNVKGEVKITVSEETLVAILEEHKQHFKKFPRSGGKIIETIINMTEQKISIKSSISTEYY